MLNIIYMILGTFVKLDLLVKLLEYVKLNLLQIGNHHLQWMLTNLNLYPEYKG